MNTKVEFVEDNQEAMISITRNDYWIYFKIVDGSAEIAFNSDDARSIAKSLMMCADDLDDRQNAWKKYGINNGI